MGDDGGGKEEECDGEQSEGVEEEYSVEIVGLCLGMVSVLWYTFPWHDFAEQLTTNTLSVGYSITLSAPLTSQTPHSHPQRP